MTPHYGTAALAALAAATCLASARTPTSAYASPETCAGCHRDIWETYRRTGMARAFFRPSPANTLEDYTRNNTYYHKASDSYFTMLRRDGTDLLVFLTASHDIGKATPGFQGQVEWFHPRLEASGLTLAG